MLRKAIAAALAAALIASACGGDSDPGDETIAEADETSAAISATAPPISSEPSSLVVTSSAYAEGERIPAEFTCDGEGTQPPYTVTDLPSGTVSIAVVMEATVPQGLFTHWVQYNMPPDPQIPEDATEVGTPGAGLFRVLGYAPPCPMGDAVGRYTLQVFAVDSVLELDEGVGKAKLLATLEGRVIGFGELTGEYSRG